MSKESQIRAWNRLKTNVLTLGKNKICHIYFNKHSTFDFLIEKGHKSNNPSEFLTKFSPNSRSFFITLWMGKLESFGVPVTLVNIKCLLAIFPHTILFWAYSRFNSWILRVWVLLHWKTQFSKLTIRFENLLKCHDIGPLSPTGNTPNVLCTKTKLINNCTCDGCFILALTREDAVDQYKNAKWSTFVGVHA